MCVNNLSKVALDSAEAGIEPATSSRKSNALTTAPPSHPKAQTWLINRVCKVCNFKKHPDIVTNNPESQKPDLLGKTEFWQC